MSDEWEDTGTSGEYSALQQAEDAVKGIEQREFEYVETGEIQTFYKYDYQTWGEAIEEGQTRDQAACKSLSAIDGCYNDCAGSAVANGPH